jgi:hypothetical protein
LITFDVEILNPNLQAFNTGHGLTVFPILLLTELAQPSGFSSTAIAEPH